MITDDGKQIIAKFMLGQAPAFASHIAAGIGPEPLLTGASASILPTKQSLDFEVFRVPILSKGFIKEDGVEKLVFKAEMPNDQRYKISEVGLFPGSNNAVAGRYDSKLLLTFSSAEPWTYVDGTSASTVPYPNLPIDQGNTTASINSSTEEFLFINSDSTMFNNESRQNRQEPPRYLNRALLVSGSSSFLTSSFFANPGSKYLENSSVSIDLSQNLPTDEIKLAFSIVSRIASDGSPPTNTRIVLKLINNVSNSAVTPPSATARIDIPGADISGNRYRIVTKKISEFSTDENFSWANINLIRIYASTLVSGSPTDDYFILFDGLRIDNVSAINPLYALVGYNIISTDDGLPILKSENTNNYIEYRFGIGVS
jgi:hypothetical protein